MVKVLRVGEPGPSMRVNKPQIVRSYWRKVIERQVWFDGDKEHLVALLLSTKYSIQGYSLVSIGSLNESIACPREIFRAAIASGAYGILLVHNHPSGDPTPSELDRALTRELVSCGNLLRVPLIDHIIIGRPIPKRRSRRRGPRSPRHEQLAARAARRGFYSLKESGECWDMGGVSTVKPRRLKIKRRVS